MKSKVEEKDIIIQDLKDLNKRTDKLIDVLAWWIPIKKWRDNFREKFKMTGQDRTGHL